MNETLYKSNSWRLFTFPVIALSCTWLFGISVGLVAVFFFKDIVQALFGAFPVFTSTAHKFFLTVLPFLFSVLTVHFFGPRCLLLICGFKAVCFSMCCCMLCLYYGQASWMAGVLFLFSDICSLPFLFLYWLRRVSVQQLPGFLKYLLLFCAILVIDYRIVTPYAMQFVIF